MPAPMSWRRRFLNHLSSKLPSTKAKDPSAALERLETWSFRATIVIFVGIVLEAWDTIRFARPGDALGDIVSKLIADGLVGFGLLVEAICIVAAIFETRREKRESDEKVAAALERAATAELETERIRKELAWRRITPIEAEKISEILSRPDLPKFGLRIEHPANDPEVITFANDIADVFRKNGWPVLFVSTVSSHAFSGMMIPLYGPEELNACAITRMAFQNAGIEFLGGYPPASSGMSMGAGDDISGPAAMIHLGSKPKPNLG